MKEILLTSKNAFTLPKEEGKGKGQEWDSDSTTLASSHSPTSPFGEGKGNKESLRLSQRNPRLLKKNLSTKRPITKRIRVGAFCKLKITALGPKDVGIDEFSYGFSILIPKAQLGETVTVQIKRIFNFQKAKYAVAQRSASSKSSGTNSKTKTIVLKKNLLSTSLKDAQAGSTSSNSDLKSQKAESAKQNSSNLKVGDIFTVKLDHIAIQTDSSSKATFDPKLGPASIGLATIVHPSIKGVLGNRSQIIIPLDPQIHKGRAQVGQEIKIKITKVKFKYAFAQALFDLESPTPSSLPSDLVKSPSNSKNLVLPLSPTGRGSRQAPSLASQGKEASDLNNRQLTKGSKITLTLPKIQKRYAKHIVMLLKGGVKGKAETQPYVLFLKNLLGAKFGDKVRVIFTKVGATFAIGKIIRISPTSPLKKLARARKNLKEMLANGMHYGEKVVKCQAQMRSYIWNRKNLSFPSASGGLPQRNQIRKNIIKSPSKDLEKNAIRPLIKKGRHLINLLKTRRCLNIGLNQLTKYAAKGRTFLFVGTKKPAAGLIARAALFTKTSFFVNTRWLGGMLTNWKTIIKSISKIRPILKEKQKVISILLEKRSRIQNRLIKKVLSLRKRSKVLITKGKLLINKVKNSAPRTAGVLIQKKARFWFERGQLLLQKRQSLLKKQNALKEVQSESAESSFLIAKKYQVLLNKLTTTHKKLHDIRLMFLVNKELRNIKKLAKEQGKNQYALSFGKFQQFSNLTLNLNQKLWLIPNPPQNILNKIILTISGASLTAKNQNQSDLSKTSSPVPSMRIAKEGTGNSNSSVKEKNITSSDSDFSSKTGQISSDSNIKKSIVLTKLLSKFSRFLPYIKNAISSMLRLMLGMVKKMTELKIHLKNLKTKFSSFLAFNEKINAELKLIQNKYTKEQLIIRVLRRKLKRQEAEKKLLQFLPKLRYLPTPKSQIALAIQILMKRFVDPKMKYPMDLIYDEKLRKKSKKVAAARKKKWQRLETYFGGIANMTKLKKTQISNNVAIIIGQQEEMNAVLECKKLGIKMFHIVDTNCNPGFADHFIPANDDSRNSIKYLLTKMVTRIRLAQKIRLRFKVLYKK